MNIPGNNVPLIGRTNEPVVLRSECIITADLKTKLVAWQEETGVHVQTLGNIIYTLGVAALAKILNDKEQRRDLDGEVERIQEDRAPEDQAN
jgi:hypothetical protein